ncbi:MAG: hypothetical protein OZ928_08645 [Polyangiaceae bacterium]|nr:hypothetical protein [Polyangiaceae bacterium]
MVARTRVAAALLALSSPLGFCRCGAEPPASTRAAAARGPDAPAVFDDARAGVSSAARGPDAAIEAGAIEADSSVITDECPSCDAGETGANGAPARRVGFALDVEDDVAAFDLASGETLAVFRFGGLVTDLCWDAPRERLVFAQTDGWADGSRVYALRYDGALTLRAASDALPAGARLACASAGVVVVASDAGLASWTLLDESLAPVGEPASLPEVASLVVAGPAALVALARHEWVSGAHHDALLRADAPGGAWTTARALLPDDPDTSLRLAPGEDASEAWLASRSRAGGRLALARLALATLTVAPPVEVALELGAGELVDALSLPEAAAVALLVETTAGATLAVAPTEPGGRVTSAYLDDHAAAGERVLHALALERETGRVLVGTRARLAAFTPSGAPGAPALARDRAFVATGLHAPVALP